MCTAYYITQHPKFSKDTHHITILEARRPAGAASGKAGGLLAMWAFPQQIVPLSFRLHQELAEQYNGSTEWGYRGLKTLSVEGNISPSNLRNIRNGSVKPNSDLNLPEALDWISPEIIDGWANLGGGESAAQVHPYKFTLFMLRKVLETGAVDFITGKVTEIKTEQDGQKAVGVTYTCHAEKRSQHIFAQPFKQKESTTAEALNSVVPSTSSRNSLHHPQNPTFNPSGNNNSSIMQRFPTKRPSLPNQNLHNNDSSHSSNESTDTTSSISETSESSINFTTDDESSSILDDSVASSVSEDAELGSDNQDQENSSNPLNNDQTDEPLPSANTDNITTTTSSSSSSTNTASSATETLTEDKINEPKSETNSKPYLKKSQHDKEKDNKETCYLEADQIVLTLGPWTSKLLPNCPISGLRAHSITIQPSKQVSPFALFTEMRTSRTTYVSPEIYPRRDEVYVCGEGDTFAAVPETSDDVEVLRDRCDELFKHVSEISPNLKNGRILKRQACYLPVVDVPSHSGPFIGNTNVENLYLASGHSCWGINNAPATGLLMAEILLDGEATSASVDGLEPEYYFDASLQST